MPAKYSVLWQRLSGRGLGREGAAECKETLAELLAFFRAGAQLPLLAKGSSPDLLKLVSYRYGGRAELVAYGHTPMH